MPSSMHRGRLPRGGIRAADRSVVRVGNAASRNIVVDWLLAKDEEFTACLAQLAETERALRESLGVLAGATPRERLGLALFFEFAREHALTAGELLLLMGDARRHLAEAAAFIAEAAVREALESCELGDDAELAPGFALGEGA